eukprot:5238886-Prymnesium_polylepis.1
MRAYSDGRSCGICERTDTQKRRSERVTIDVADSKGSMQSSGRRICAEGFAAAKPHQAGMPA